MTDESDRLIAHAWVQREQDLLVIRRRAGRYLGGQWDIPGGTVEPGESAAEAAVRETIEEAGLVVIPGEKRPSWRRGREGEISGPGLGRGGVGGFDGADWCGAPGCICCASAPGSRRLAQRNVSTSDIAVVVPVLAE